MPASEPAGPAALARRSLPGHRIEPGELIEVGWDNQVLLATVDGERWVFRFPRRPDVLPDIDREQHLLRMLSGRLPVAVPDWRVRTILDGRTVIGYPALPGIPAGHEPRGDGDFVFAIDIPPPEEYVVGLGSTLAALHAIPLTEVPTPPPSEPERPQRQRDLDHLVTLTPIPDPVLRTWRRWLADEELWPEPSVLVHGDVHPGHTLVDQTGALTGIIDWTDATIGCPATDFIDQRHAFGAEVADRLVRAYAAAGGSLPARFREQIIMRQSLRPLGALLFGLGGSAPETARPDLVRRSHERLADQAARIEAGRCPV